MDIELFRDEVSTNFEMTQKKYRWNKDGKSLINVETRWKNKDDELLLIWG